MTEILYLIIGLLVGGIATYIYLTRKAKGTMEVLADEMVKNRLLKEEIGRKGKSPKYKSKKRYYGNKKKANG